MEQFITGSEHPDYLVLDLDPSLKNTFGEVIETALQVNEVLKSILERSLQKRDNKKIYLDYLQNRTNAGKRIQSETQTMSFSFHASGMGRIEAGNETYRFYY